MIKHIDSRNLGRSQQGWLDSHFHFSFANYYNPDNMRFGVLRVVNDDLVKPNTGFDTHPHRDMEIISYVVNGELSHADSMENKRVLKRGQVQYMSAGTGVFHSEHNRGEETLRFLQIWITPDKNGYEPNYGDFEFEFSDRIDQWLPIASSMDNKELNAPIDIHADVNVYAAVVSEGKSLGFKVRKNRQAYLVLVEGHAEINSVELSMRDALEITEEDININAVEDAHILVIEMAKI